MKCHDLDEIKRITDISMIIGTQKLTHVQLFRTSIPGAIIVQVAFIKDTFQKVDEFIYIYIYIYIYECTGLPIEYFTNTKYKIFSW